MSNYEYNPPKCPHCGQNLDLNIYATRPLKVAWTTEDGQRHVHTVLTGKTILIPWDVDAVVIQDTEVQIEKKGS